MRISLVVILVMGLNTGPLRCAPLCPPRIDWQTQRPQATYPGYNTFKPISGGGYFLAGVGYGSNPDQSINYGNGDFLLVRLDADFQKIWDQSFGGTNWDAPYLAQELGGGGFILAGDSFSGPSGNKSSPLFGLTDFWVVRTDAAGNKLWDRSYGGTNSETLLCLLRTGDGGFIIGGASQSEPSGNKTSPAYGFDDYWVVRTDADGNMIWNRSFGGEQRDALTAILQTADGGFLLGGSSQSGAEGSKSTPNFGGSDYWVIRVDANGNQIWQASYGGIGNDDLIAMSQSGSKFILVGSSDSPPSDSPPSGNRTSPRQGYRDYWIVIIDDAGTITTQQSFGGASYAEAKAVLTTPDGGWVIGGTAGPGPGGNKTGPTFGYTDYWLVRLDLNGALVWDQTYGGNSTDEFYGMDRTSDGGIFLNGLSYSGVSGNKTIASAGLWALKLALETPGDCDGDGIPDEQDLCGATTGGAIVNSNGCSIAQLCPCDGGWRDHDEYKDCVARTSADFLAAGRITEEQRAQIMAEAAAAACPFPPVLAFGLTNFPIHQATVTFESGLFVSNLGYDGNDGLSMRLGEADSGLFIYPYASVQDNYDAAWFMLAKAYGSVDGATNVLLSTMRGTKPYYEVYPVEVDFSALGASSLTFQVYASNVLVAAVTNSGPVGSLTINSGSYLGPRANPLWRAPDGSIGAVIDLNISEAYRFYITGPFDQVPDDGIQGDHIFIRANSPTGAVDFVSRIDITEGGGLFDFTVQNARLGMFGRGHEIIGGVFNAAGSKLKIAQLPENETTVGTIIEAGGVRQFDAALEPVALHTNDAMFEMLCSGLIDSGVELLGTMWLQKLDGALQLNADFNALYPAAEGTNTTPPAQLLFKVYDNGTLAGSLTNWTTDTNLVLIATNSVPGVVAGGVRIHDPDGPDSIDPPFFAFTLNEHAILSDGAHELRGNYFRISPIDPQRRPRSISSLALQAFNFPAFTITGESTEVIAPPLAIARSENTVSLSWPNQNHPFMLQSTASLGTPFGTVANDVRFVDGRNTVTLPIEPSSNRFFRLLLSPD